MTLRRIILVLLTLCTALLIGWAASNTLFLSRYISFFVHGGDPHLIQVNWFTPAYPIRNTSPARPPIPPREAAIPPLEQSAYEAAAQYADAQGGIALLIAREGQMVFEHYAPGVDRETLINPQSMSKSLLALAIGRAITTGAIGSVDDPISTYMPELSADPRGDISIENLLQMAGGLEQISTGYAPYPWSRGVRQHFGTDFNYWVMQLQPVDPPGTRFDYNNNETNLLGIVLERATGQSYQDYLATEIWPALDLGAAHAYLDRPGGAVMKSCCILSRPIDWLRLGQLILDDGKIAGQPFIDTSYMRAMTAPSPLFPGYGYQVWRHPLTLRGGYIGERSPPSPLFWWASEDYAAPLTAFAGFGFHMTWIIPSLSLVIVRINGPQWPQEAFDQSKIPNLLIRALAQQ